MLEVTPSSIQFDDVAVNDIPSYRQFHIQNQESFPITVKISSEYHFVKVQYHNENLSTSDNVKRVDLASSYDESFDYADLVQSVELNPLEGKELIIWFRAAPSVFSHIMAQSAPSTFTGTLQLAASTSQVAKDASTFNYSRNASKDLSSTTSPLYKRQHSAASVTSPASPSTVSTSELQTTLAPPKTQIMDFSVTNVSSKPLFFVIRNQSFPINGLNLELYEVERFEDPKLGHRLLLDSHASMNLSLMARTSAVGLPVQQYQAVLQCDNLLDPRNTTLIYVNINIVAESQGDLVSMSDTTISFGDVYRGTKATVELGFLNVDGREDATLHLGSGQKWRGEGEISLMKGDTPVDEVLIPAQKGMVYVSLMYKPAYNAQHTENSKVKFEVDFFLTAAAGTRQQRIVTRCTASLFTSMIKISQASVNFGDCQVGQSKRNTFFIENQSPLPGSVVIQIRSKIIGIEGMAPQKMSLEGRETQETFSIAPLSTLPITLRITPQRVNPTYRKQLTIINTLNPAEDRHIINIESNNMAPSEAKLHDEIYTWECLLQGQGKTNQGGAPTPCAITNVPLLVPYVAKSKVDHPVTLNIRSTCAEVEVFYVNDPQIAGQMDHAAAKLRSYCMYGDEEEVNQLTHVSPEAVQEARRELFTLLEEYAIITNSIILEPQSTVKTYALIIRSSCTTESFTKEDGLSIAIDGVEAPRFVRLSYKLCGTSLELLGQKTKNFGEVNIGVKKTTKLPVVNRYKSVLFLRISKSRSVTAGHIRIEKSDKQSIYMAIRPFATLEVEVIFYPGIKGAFEEKIELTNILNPKNRVSMTLKATVVKADTFDVTPDSWSFGVVVVPPVEDPPQLARVGAKFTVSNTSKARRQILLKLGTNTSDNGVRSNMSNGTEIQPDDRLATFLQLSGVDLGVQLEMELSGPSSGSTRKIEEQIEKLEHKLKIYERKKKTEKKEAAQKRIETLRRALLGEEVDPLSMETSAGAEHDFSESEDEFAQTGAKKNRYHQPNLLSVLLQDGVSLPTMNAGESVVFVFGLTCARIAEEIIPAAQTTTLNLLLYEAKDQEVNRIVPIDITLVRQEGETGSPQLVGHGAAAPLELHGPSHTSLAHDKLSNITLIPGGSGCVTSTFMGHPLMVLPNCIVNDPMEFTILVKASSSTTIVVLEPRRCGGPLVQALDARFKFFPRNGAVSEDDVLHIIVECTPRSVGPQKYFIPVKNLQNGVDVRYFVVELNPTEEEELITVEPKEMEFHDVITPCHPARLEVQLLLIRSRFPYPHALLVRSNTPSQVSFFEDAQCTVLLQNPIQRTFMRETIRAYVRFQPSPRATQEVSRVVRFGVLVEAITPTGDGAFCLIGKSVVRSAVRVGSGALRVAKTNLELGSLRPSDTAASATLHIHNPSDYFSIRARLATSSANIVVSEGCTEWTLPPKAELSVPLVLRLPSPGLVQEQMTLYNLSCHQEPIPIHLSALRMDPAVSASFPSREREHTMHLPVAAVARGEDGELYLTNPVCTSLPLRNHSTKDIFLVVESAGLQLYFGEPQEGGSGKAPGSPTGRGGSDTGLSTYSGGRVRLEARHHQAIPLTLTGVPPLDPQQIAEITQHGVTTVSSVVQVCVAQIVGDTAFSYGIFHVARQLPSVGQCVLLVNIVASFAMSEGEAQPAHIDMGSVGLSEHENHGGATTPLSPSPSHVPKRHQLSHLRNNQVGHHHRDGPPRLTGDALSRRRFHNSSVVIHLRNLSPYLPLRLNVECQPTLHFASSHIVIPAGQTADVEAQLQLKLIPTQGPFRYEAFFVNELNSENDIAVAITGRYYWKIFQFSCDGNNDVRESMTLPPLHVDTMGTTPCLLSQVKFVIAVTEVDTEVQLAMQVQPNPKFRDLLEVQVLHYDATSTVDRLVFPAAEGQGGAADGNASGSSNLVGATSSGGIPSASGSGVSNALASSPAASSTRRKVPQRSQTVRIRCVLRENNFAAVAALFFGYRKRQAMQETWTFERLAELEQRRTTSASNTMWLGTVLFLNALTDDEEIEVFAQLDPFATFSAPAKVTIRPARLPVAPLKAAATPSSSKDVEAAGRSAAAAATAASQAEDASVAFVGELSVVNSCAGYTVELAAMVLISDQLSTKVHVELSGGMPTEEALTQASSANERSPHVCRRHSTTQGLATETDAHRSNSSSRTSYVTAVTVFTNGNDTDDTNSTRHSGDTNKSAAGGSHAQASPRHRVSIAPQETVTLRVLVRCTDPKETLHMKQAALEQLVALALVDENVPFSVSVVRLNAVPIAGLGEDELSSSISFLPQDHPERGAVTPSPTKNSVAGGPMTPAAFSAAASPIGVGKAGGTGGGGAQGTTARTPVTADELHTEESRDSGPAGSAAPEELSKTPLALSSVLPVLSLKNCTPMQGCPGSYWSAFSFPREEVPETAVAVRNNLRDEAVHYTVTVVSQGPLPWLLLPSSSGMLEAGETQPLRLNLLSVEAGSFMGYLAITNSVNPLEIVYLRLSAEVFVPTAGEGLFELLVSNGQRVGSNAVRPVAMGPLYGVGSSSVRISLEITNRGNVALEFPVSVVKPFRVELRPQQDALPHLSSYHRRRAAHGAATGTSFGVSLEKRAGEPPTAAATSTTPQQQQPTGSSVGPASLSEGEEGRRATPGNLLVPRGLHEPVFEGWLAACYISGVSTQTAQKYIVVNPKSRVRLAFVLNCSALRVPEGFGAFGEADIVFTCKQARDAHFTFTANFNVRQPTFAVARDHEVPATDDGEVRVEVRNLLSTAQQYAFRSPSPVLYAFAGTGSAEDDLAAASEAHAALNFSSTAASAPASFVTVDVPAQSTGYFVVGLDRRKAAALLNFDKDDVHCPILAEHGFLLRVENPQERVQLMFRQLPIGARREVGEGSAALVSDSAIMPAVRPVKVGGQHLREQLVVRFAQQFMSTLNQHADRLLAAFRHYEAKVNRRVQQSSASSTSESDDSDNDTPTAEDLVEDGIAEELSRTSVPTPVNNALPDSADRTVQPPSTSGRRTLGGTDTALSQSATMWCSLHSLLLELVWLVDELVFYTVLLRNSRLIESYSVFVNSVVSGHPVVKQWREYKSYLPKVQEYQVFAQLLEVLEALPYTSSSAN